MALRLTPVRRVGTLSTLLANAVLYASHAAHLQTPFSALLLGGGLFRGLTLPLTLYGDQCLSRTAAALPELQEAHHQYTDIVNHPRAIVWERRVAAQKLKNDRDRIFRNHRTNNVKMLLPHVLALLSSWYLLGIPSQQLGEFFTVDAGMDIVSPLAVTAWRESGSGSWMMARTVNLAANALSGASVSVAVDPTLTVAATLTLYSVLQHLKRREGFNDRLDAYLTDARRLCLAAYALVATAGLVATPIASALSTAVFFPSYLGPIWLGMAGTTVVKTVLLNNTAPGRALCRIQSYPPQHGTYGGESTAEGHEYRLAFTGVDAEEKREVWQTQKRALDYECDVRLHKFLSRMGLFDSVEELEYEAEKLRERRKIAHERALQRKAKEHSAAASSTTSTATGADLDSDAPSRREVLGETEATMTAVQRRRMAREQRRQAYQKQQEEKEQARQADIAKAVADVAAAGEDKWRSTVNITRPGATMPASFFKDGEPLAADFASQYLDEYNTDLSQRRVDRQSARESTYQRRGHITPEEHLLGEATKPPSPTTSDSRDDSGTDNGAKPSRQGT